MDGMSFTKEECNLLGDALISFCKSCSTKDVDKCKCCVMYLLSKKIGENSDKEIILHPAKFYSSLLIQEFIEANKDVFTSVSVGIEEDWFWTAQQIWNSYDGYLIDLSEEHPTIGGISYSLWGTPCIQGYVGEKWNSKRHPCYVEGDACEG